MWGIGAVLFEAATAQPAFDDPEPSDEGLSWSDSVESEESASLDDESLEDHEYPRLRARAARIAELRLVPDDVDELVAACLEPEPAMPPSVGAVLARLKPLAGLPFSERRYGRRGTTARTPAGGEVH